MDINRILRETFVVEVEHHDELGSTNDRAIQRAKQGASRLPLLVIADRQTAGRGRGGNRWWTGPGSLAFSLLLESAAVEGKAGSVPLISLAVGVAVAETVEGLLKGNEIGICWPNDVIAAGRKLAGILVEVLPDGHAVVGIGINTNDSMADAPAELQPLATTMLELSGARHDHTEILVALLNRLERHIVALKRDPAEIAARADALCLQRDKPIALQQARQTITGLCRGIAPDGALLVETPDGLQSYYSGTIIR
jgi:BirA family transcriptional regulator, biotin operon repressor / biotin---[acetyl-CoA-carboxylase] ligase